MPASSSENSPNPPRPPDSWREFLAFPGFPGKPRVRLCAVFLWGCAVLLAATGCRRQDGLTYPGTTWAWAAPDSAGFSSEKLNAFSDAYGGTGLIVHGGKLIHEWGDTAFPNDAASATKFFYTFLTLRAMEEGRIDSLDDSVAKWAPELLELNADLGHKDRKITFRQLLMQTSGYGLTEAPGERFAYNDHATSLLAWILFYRVYERDPMQYDEVLNGEIFRDWMELEHHFTAIHRNSPRGRLRISARDLARLGLLHLRNGRWEGKQIVDADLLQSVMNETLPMDMPRSRGEDAEEIPGLKSLGGGKNEKNHLGCLGYFWWQNHLASDGNRLLDAAPPGTRMASGYGGRFAMILIPEYDLVIVWFDVHRGEVWSPFDEIGRQKVNDMLKELLAARV